MEERGIVMHTAEDLSRNSALRAGRWLYNLSPLSPL